MEGFYVPIHRSVTTPILMGGVPRDFALVNGILSAAIIVGMGAVIWLPFAALLQLAGGMLGKWDPDFVVVVKRHMDFKPYYHA